MPTIEMLRDGFAGVATVVQEGALTRSRPTALEFDLVPASTRNEHEGLIIAWFDRTEGIVHFEVRGENFIVCERELRVVRRVLPTRAMPFVHWSLREVPGKPSTRWAVCIASDVLVASLTIEQLRHIAEALQSAAQRVYGVIRAARRHANAHCNRERERDNALFDVRWEIDELVGLTPVKAFVDRLAAEQIVARRRRAADLEVAPSSPHLVFTGNPGTGKTTVARLIGRLYAALGLLEKGHVVEAERSTLVGAYLGQTAARTAAACESALGGVLFVDEAYSLDVDGRDYGREAIETILTFMENHRGRIVVIMAGYPEEMEHLLDSNPGLRSRFDATVHFPDHTTEDLLEVIGNLFDEFDYSLSVAAQTKLREHVASLPRGRGFGNAREMHKLFRNLVGTHATWLCAAGEDEPADDADLSWIEAHMIPDPISAPPPPPAPRTPFNLGYL